MSHRDRDRPGREDAGRPGYLTAACHRKGLAVPAADPQHRHLAEALLLGDRPEGHPGFPPGGDALPLGKVDPPASGSRRRWVGPRTRDGGTGCRGRPAGPSRFFPRREGTELGETLRTEVVLTPALRLLRSADGSSGSHAHEAAELPAIDTVAGGHMAGRDQEIGPTTPGAGTTQDQSADLLALGILPDSSPLLCEASHARLADGEPHAHPPGLETTKPDQGADITGGHTQLGGGGGGTDKAGHPRRRMRRRHPSKRVRARGRELDQGGLRDQPGVAHPLALQIPPAQRAPDDPEIDSKVARGVRCGEWAAHAPRWKGHSVSPPPQLEGGWSGGACAVGPARAHVRRAAINPRALSSRVDRIPW